MKNLRALKKFEKYKIIETLNFEKNIKSAKKIRGPLSEIDILDLEDKFLTNGFHYINVNDVESGRVLVYQFLDSLPCYGQRAALSIASTMLDNSITDVYYELVKGGYIDSPSYMEEFFIEQFYYDFMWIEACNHLVDYAWFSEFFGKMVSYKLDQHIPILIISYRQ